VLAAYERTRALLAADKLEGLADAARELETSAKAAGAGPHYGDIATSAAKLAIATDLDAARASFGDVSKHVVALLAGDPSLAQGQHVFECPMVKGYKKWVQPTQDLQNPYMGKRMLACGGKSTWK
jgi:Cu(I)/Ag(I) efflux system membrane fusion protein